MSTSLQVISRTGETQPSNYPETKAFYINDSLGQAKRDGGVVSG